jgi:serine/threonine protein kinase
MIDPRLTVQLIDFGIADVFPDGHTGHPLGTDGYAAPEQYDGVVTPQTDIYALGATLHHLVTHVDPRLEPPFSFIDRPIRVYNPDISPALEAVIMRALAQSPAYRFGSAREMMEAIKSAPESRSG